MVNCVLFSLQLDALTDIRDIAFIRVVFHDWSSTEEVLDNGMTNDNFDKRTRGIDIYKAFKN